MPRHDGSRLEEARRLDGEIRERHRHRNQLIVEIAERLEAMEKDGLEKALGFESVQAYGERALGYSASKTRALVGIARRLPELPAVREAALAGELPWTKLRHVTAVASRETESEWLKKARVLSSRKLERAVAAARGEELLETLRLELTSSQLADIDDAVTALRRESPELSLGAAVAEACRRAVIGDGAAGGSRYRVVVTTCGECGSASREAREGSIAVETSELERVACDSEILDTRRTPVRLRRTMPPSVANALDARDRGRCRVPGCVNRAFVERHHEGGWRQVGHDPARLFLLCSSHHAARHEGDLVVTFEGDEPVFSLADRTPLSDSREAGDSREALSTAEAALRTLGFRAHEARTLVASVRGVAGGVPELVVAALRAAPMPAAS